MRKSGRIRVLRAATVVLGLIVFTFSLSGCHPKSAVPPEVLAQLTAAVENDGRHATPVDVFSMPGDIEPARARGDQAKVTGVAFEGSPGSLGRETAGVAAGTVLYYYGVKVRRTKADGSLHFEDRLFLVYKDATGGWLFTETKRPDYDAH